MNKHNKWQTNQSKKNQFEGYYFRHTTTKQQSISFIIGVSTFIEDPHCFIQIIQSHPATSHYIRYPLECFKITKYPFTISIHKNSFTEHSCHIQIERTHLTCHADFHYGTFSPLKTIMLNNHVMGPFQYLPAMECKHSIVSMNHDVEGTVIINQQNVVFPKGSRGYIEKDWGSSFPSSYVWIQANTFPTKTSFFCSIARIPYLSFVFPGFLCVLQYDQKQLVFATYLGSTLLYKNHDCIIFKHKEYTLLVEPTNHTTLPLVAPLKGHMNVVIKEGLQASLQLTLYKGKTKVFENTCNGAAMESVNADLFL